MIKLIAFDLDGTLTQHKTPLDEKNRAVLEALGKKYSLLMVGAGQCRRIFNQMGGFPIDVIGNYGLQYCRYDATSQDLAVERDLTLPCDRESVEKRVTYFREKYGLYTEELRVARANGLPYRLAGGTKKQHYVYREIDVNNYYAGKIGNDVNKRRRKI